MAWQAKSPLVMECAHKKPSPVVPSEFRGRRQGNRNCDSRKTGLQPVGQTVCRFLQPGLDQLPVLQARKKDKGKSDFKPLYFMHLVDLA